MHVAPMASGVGNSNDDRIAVFVEVCVVVEAG